MSSRSIIPRGFERTSHEIFFEYINPLLEINLNTFKQKKKIQKDEKERKEEERKEEEEEEEDSNNRKKEKKSLFQSDLCSICLSSYENPVTLIFCHHSYCFCCLLNWLIKKQQCPLCKACGSFFIQNNYFKSTESVKILSISTKTENLTIEIIDEAINIHKRRFQFNNSLNNYQSSLSITTSTKRKRKHSNQIIQAASSQTTTTSTSTIQTIPSEERLITPLSNQIEILTEEQIDYEIKRITREIVKIQEKVVDLDAIIANSQQCQHR